MTVRYDGDARHLGMSVTRYRDALRSWAKTGDLSQLANGSIFDGDIVTAAVVVDDAEARGFFGMHTEYGRRRYGPTETGEALLGATPMRPIPAQKGWALANGVVANAAKAAADGSLPFKVRRIWCYGSLVRDAPSVNDVDLVVEIEHEPGLTEDKVQGDEARRMAIAMGGASFLSRQLGNSARPAADFVAGRTLYGARMNPRISVGQLDELIAMHQPCRLLYDRKRGGRVEDPTLPHHPASTGRNHARFKDIRRMPDLAVGPVQPVCIEYGVGIACEFRYHGEIRCDFGPFFDLAGSPEGVWTSAGSRPFGTRMQEWADASGPLDGRASGAIVFERSHQGYRSLEDSVEPILALRLDREVAGEGGGLVRYRIDTPAFLDPAARSEGAMMSLVNALAGCLVADVAAISLRTGAAPEGVRFILEQPGPKARSQVMRDVVLACAENLRELTARSVAWKVELRERRKLMRSKHIEDDVGDEASMAP